MQDFYLLEKMAHFNRERITERVFSDLESAQLDLLNAIAQQSIGL